MGEHEHRLGFGGECMADPECTFNASARIAALQAEVEALREERNFAIECLVRGRLEDEGGDDEEPDELRTDILDYVKRGAALSRKGGGA